MTTTTQPCGSGDDCWAEGSPPPAVAVVAFPGGQFNTATVCSSCLTVIVEETFTGELATPVTMNIVPVGVSS